MAVQSELPSRPKSKPKKETTSATDSSNAGKQAACSPPFDYLVPISICIRSPPNLQQPQVDEQPVVERVSWALLSRLSGETESSWSLRVAAPKEAGQTQNCCSLSEAIQQVDKSLEGKNCTLVTCGPVPLRQHLHPIAKRLRLELSDHFSQYVDLLKEFDRCTFANNLTGRQVARANGAATSLCPCWPACESAPRCGERENVHHQRVTSSGLQRAGDESATAPPGQQPAQPISQGSRKRFEEILKFLLINLETGKSKPVCSATLAGNQCSCLACSQAFVEASCSIVERLLREGHSFNRLERIKRRVEVGLCETSAHEAEQRVVRARGLPWQASEQDIADFFTGLNIAKGGVGLCLSRQGRRNGEALIQFESREHRNLALSRHKHFMGNRYIEVYRASGDDFQSVAAGYNNKAEAFISKGAQFIVRMRGLPFTCTAKQVVDFFASSDTRTKACEVFAGEDGVLFVRNQDEKPTGDAFVLFATDEQARRAIAKHHQNIGTRYVELFRSTVSEVQQVLSVSMGPDGGEEQAPAVVSGKQQSASATKPKQQASTMAEKSKSASSKSPASKSPISKSTGASYTNQLDSRSAFPALNEKPIAWQRPDAATYAQVAHSKRILLGEKSPSKPEQEVDKPLEVEKLSVAKSDEKTDEMNDLTKTRELVIASEEQQESSIPVEDQLCGAKSDKSQSCTEIEAVTSGCEKLSLTEQSDQSSSGRPSTSHSPGSCSASSSAAMATPNLVRSPISSLSSSSEDSSSSNLSYKQAATHPHHYHYNNQHADYHPGARRYPNQHQHQQQHYQSQSGRSLTRYQQNYMYHQTAAMMPQQQAVMYNHELMQTTMQQHSASMAQAPYPAPHYQMAYATTQAQAMAGTFDPSQQLAGQQQPPPPPYTANSMQQHQDAQQVYATAAAASAADPALMSRRDCIRLRGLPFEAQIDDVLQFLGKHSENILYQGVHMVYSAQGQPTGEAIIQMNSTQAASGAAQEAHRRVMSVGKKQRYIEVIPSSIDDLKPTLGYGLAAFAASRAAASYGMHLMHYAAYAAAAAAGGAQMGPIDPITGYLLHHHQLPYMEPAADCYPIASADQTVATMASASSASSETTVSPAPEHSSALSSKQVSDSEANPEEGDTPSGTLKPASEPENAIQEAKETQSEAASVVRASSSSDNGPQPITTTATSGGQQMQQQQQQQQALMAAAQAAAYYPILYYYPSPQQPILATAAPGATRYH